MTLSRPLRALIVLLGKPWPRPEGRIGAALFGLLLVAWGLAGVRNGSAPVPTSLVYIAFGA